MMEIALCYNGLLALCLAMPKHYRQLFGRSSSDHVRWALKIAGWSAMAGSLLSAIASNGWSFGPVEWIGMTSVTGVVLIFLWPFRPQAVAILGALVVIAAATGVTI